MYAMHAYVCNSYRLGGIVKSEQPLIKCSSLTLEFSETQC